MQGQEPNPQPLAFVSLERASNSQPVQSLLWGPGVAAGSFLLEAEVQALSLGRCLSPPAGPRCPTSPAVPEGAQRGPFLQAREPGGRWLFLEGERSRGVAARPPGARGALPGSGPGSSRTLPAKMQLAPGASRIRASESIPPLPSQPLRPERPGRLCFPGRWSADCRALCDPRP